MLSKTNRLMTKSYSTQRLSKITTILFDVDDTLYDVGTGFTAHRNTEGATSFMVAKLGFPTVPQAKAVRDEYFSRYHSTAKGLTVAEEEGKLPPPPPGWPEGKKQFDPKDLSQWWATNLKFELLQGPYPHVEEMLSSCPLNLIAFSNGPRTYVLRALREMGLNQVFPPEKVFAVDDVLPHCKPEKGAFTKVLEAVGDPHPSECIMVEDSMKNIRVAKELGMYTVLISGLNRGSGDGEDGVSQSLADAAEATKSGDAPNKDDEAVDTCIECVADLKNALPLLWEMGEPKI